MKHLQLLLFFLSIHLAISAKQNLSRQKDSLKADSLFELAWKYRNSYPDSSFYFANKSLDISKDNDFHQLNAYNLGRIGEYYRNKTLYEKAYQYLVGSLRVRKDYRDTNDIFNGYINLGNLFIYQEKYDSAIFYFKQGLTHGTSSSFLSQQGKALNGLSVAYLHSGKYELAEITLNDALNIGIRQGDSLGIAKRYQNLAGFYEKINRDELALKNYRLCSEIFEELRDDLGIIDVKINVAAIYLRQEKYKEAIGFLELAELKSSERGFLRKRLSILNNLGFAYLATNDLDKAERKFKEGLNFAYKSDQKKAFVDLSINYAYLLKSRKRYRELLKRSYFLENLIKEENLNQFLYHIYLLRADAEAEMGDYESAFKTRLKFFAQQDNLAQKIDDAQVLAANIEQEKSEKALLKERNLRQETELQKQKVENSFKTMGIWALSTLVVLLVFILLLKLRNTKIKVRANQEKQKRDEELFNILKKVDLQILETQLEAKEQASLKIGQDLHDNLGSKLAVIQMLFDGIYSKLQLTNDQLKSRLEKMGMLIEESCEDMRNVAHDLMDSELKERGLLRELKQFFSLLDGVKKIKFEFRSIDSFSEQLLENTEKDILAILRLLTENVLRHSNANKVIVEVEEVDSTLYFRMLDNGDGFDIEHAFKNGGKGLKNARDRAYQLGGIFKIESGDDGTSSILTIPLKRNIL